MRIAIVYMALLVSMFSASAENSETVSKENAIKAFQEYRAGVKLISAIHIDLMQASFAAAPVDEIEIPKRRIEDYKRARKHLEKSITLNPYFPHAYALLANSYWEIVNDSDYDDVISAGGQVFIILNLRERNSNQY